MRKKPSQCPHELFASTSCVSRTSPKKKLWVSQLLRVQDRWERALWNAEVCCYVSIFSASGSLVDYSCLVLQRKEHEFFTCSHYASAKCSEKKKRKGRRQMQGKSAVFFDTIMWCWIQIDCSPGPEEERSLRLHLIARQPAPPSSSPSNAGLHACVCVWVVRQQHILIAVKLLSEAKQHGSTEVYRWMVMCLLYGQINVQTQLHLAEASFKKTRSYKTVHCHETFVPLLFIASWQGTGNFLLEQCLL